MSIIEQSELVRHRINIIETMSKEDAVIYYKQEAERKLKAILGGNCYIEVEEGRIVDLVNNTTNKITHEDGAKCLEIFQDLELHARMIYELPTEVMVAHYILEGAFEMSEILGGIVRTQLVDGELETNLV
jgi:hypothetical protein